MTTRSDTVPPVAPALRASGNWLQNPQVTMNTTLGSVVFELYPNAAPITAANWLAYVNTDFFDGLLFHRVMPDFVVQGGGFTSGGYFRTPSYNPIALESNNGLSNVRGTLAMARTSAADSATSQFYVNLVDNTQLNYRSSASPGYAVFGAVVDGMTTIDAIARVPTTAIYGVPNIPVTEVQISSATQSRAGVIHSTSGALTLSGLETGATWQYSLDRGAHWTVQSGATLTLAAGAYEAGLVQVRQRDAAGNTSGIGLPGADIIVDTRTPIAGNASANRLTGTAGDDAIYGLGGNDTLDGGGGNDTLNAGSGNDTLDGGSGNDTLIGGTGNDTYYLRDTGDRITEAAGGGTDTVYSDLASHTLSANVENGRIMRIGSASLTGNALSNTLYAGRGANVLNGGSGTEADTVSYLFGTGATAGVTVSLALGTPQATGGSGTDTLLRIENLTGSPNNDRLTGSTGNNALDGGAGNDTLSGGAGDDTLTGGTGNDLLIGGAGSDRLTGGAGVDSFRFVTRTEGTDRLTDFVSGTDRIQVVSTNFGLPVGTLAAGRLVAVGTTLADTTPVFIYDAATGALAFDSNGRTAGGLSQIAVFTGSRPLAASDIEVVSA